MPKSKKPEIQDILALGENVQLHPDLESHLEEHPALGTIIRHPLVFSVPHNSVMNGLLNAQYEAKRKKLGEAFAQSNWTLYIYLHERPYRLSAFSEIENNLRDTEYWSLLGSIYSDSENIWQMLTEWEDLLSSPRPSRQSFMSEDDLAKFNALPESMTIYRGFNGRGTESGLSWTLNKEQAVWFARRFDLPDGQVAVGSALKSDVIGYLGSRNEDEIVINPDYVQIEEIYSLSKMAAPRHQRDIEP